MVFNAYVRAEPNIFSFLDHTTNTEMASIFRIAAKRSITTIIAAKIQYEWTGGLMRASAGIRRASGLRVLLGFGKNGSSSGI